MHCNRHASRLALCGAGVRISRLVDSFGGLFHKRWLESGIDAMLRIGRDKDVAPNVHAGAGTFFERDDGQTIKKVIQNLLTLLSCLLRDPVANLGRRREYTAVVTNLSQPT